MNVSRDQQELSMPAVAGLVASYLHTSPASLDPDAPFSQYGLDSLSSAGLITHLSERTHRELPDFLLLDCPTIRSLHHYLSAERLSIKSSRLPDAAALERMRADANLAPDIYPASPMREADGVRTVLLTGASGFLGSKLLAALLQQHDTRVVCLLRATADCDAAGRLSELLKSRRSWAAARNRVTAIDGDLSRPRFGLSEADFDELGGRLQAIYHCAASVNWALPYEALRATNVLGTEAVLRLACTVAAKPVHFVSTIGVCLATPGPAQVTEDDDPFENLGRLHFGYVQSKCVAEELLQCAARRGLPVRVYRPSLLSGDSASGQSDPEGFLSRLLIGCVQMGCAPDLDWLVDCCPVDYVARCIVAVSGSKEARPRRVHLINPQPRHWREIVLWMNLYGYPVQLLPFPQWLQHMQDAARENANALHGLQNFFLARPAAGNGLALPQLYEEGRKSNVRADATAELISRLGLAFPPVDARLLGRYFGDYIDAGRLPRPRPDAVPARHGGAISGDLRTIVDAMQLTYGDEPLTVLDVSRIEGGSSGESIITELSSWRFRNIRGLFPCRLVVRGPGARATKFFDVFLKCKPHDSEVIAIGEQVGELCEAGLGNAVSRHADALGFTGCHLRELGIYAQTDSRFRQFTPACYGRCSDEAGNRWILALEYLSDVTLIDSANDIRGWTPDYLRAAIDGMAALHAVWYRRENELIREPWLGPHPSLDNMTAAAGLWDRLARFSGPLFREWAGPDVIPLQREFIEGVEEWWRELQNMPRTLIHQDCNPRNIAFRRKSSGPRLCVYDWELATLGIPQRDLAELMCFVLPPDSPANVIEECVEQHRIVLEAAAGTAIDRSEWRRGFELALRDLLVNRLAMYALIHKFRRQEFLPRITSTWLTIQRHIAHVYRPNLRARG